MPFLLAEILNFQGSTHHIGVGSFSLLVISGGVDAVKGLLNIGGLLMTIPTVWLFLSLPKIGGKLLKCEKQVMEEETQ